MLKLKEEKRILRKEERDYFNCTSYYYYHHCNYVSNLYDIPKYLAPPDE